MKKMNLWVLVSSFLFTVLATSSAHAIPETKFSTDKALAASYGDISDYQIGDEWGKKQVRVSTLEGKSAAFVRAAYSTVYITVGGTGFYIGKHNGEHVIATNHHVCPTNADCVGQKAQFRILGKSYRITQVLVSMPDVDLSLVTINVPASDDNLLKPMARSFAFRKHIYRGEPLITIGFGIGGNPHNYMMANEDSDCVVYSDSGDYRHLADPDRVNPATYKAWSFAHGCDISHGDSGSAMIDRNTGEIVGIVWTGVIPKNKKVQNSRFMQSLLRNPNEGDVWGQLSYAVPSVKIGEYLAEAAGNPGFHSEIRKIFASILSSK